jgi:hypothetical protein
MADVMPALNQFDLVARDVEAAVAFYRLLGLDIPETAIWYVLGRALPDCPGSRR